MIIDFLEHECHPSEVVYTNEQYVHLLHLDDISAAPGTDTIKLTSIITGNLDHMQSSWQRQALTS